MQNATNTYNYLKLIPFINFDLWDTKRYTSKSITSSFDIVDLGSCIKEENKKYKLFEEEDREFGILGVNNKEGIFDAYIQKGKDINQAYKKMEVGWLAYNPYRINVGSIGIRLKEHKNEYISPAYVVFSCKENLLPEYLYLVFKTQTFNKVINESTTGSVRQNLTIDILKKLKIPLPTIAEQQKMVNAYQAKKQQAISIKKQASELEIDIEKYLFDSLGIINKKKTKINSYLQVFDFSKIERWSVDYIKEKQSSILLLSGKYEPVKLKEFIISYQYGLSEKASKENVGIPMLRMNNIYNSVLNIDDLKYIPCTKDIDKYKLNKGDLLFNRTNSKELVGKTALFNLQEDFTFASYLIRVVIDTKKADVEYINYLFNSSILQFQKDLVSRQITGQANINAQEMKEFLFPFPPLDVQKEISSVINKMKNEGSLLIDSSLKLEFQAEQEFEKQIFG